MSKKITSVVVSGYFDPIHVGHLEFLELAKKLGDTLTVIINNNLQAELKKGSTFMDEKDRMEIVAALRCVDEVFLSIDTDKSVCKSLEHIKPDIFANGGDRSDPSKVRELEIAEKLKIELKFGVGGNHKESSSSDLLKRWSEYLDLKKT